MLRLANRRFATRQKQAGQDDPKKSKGRLGDELMMRLNRRRWLSKASRIETITGPLPSGSVYSVFFETASMFEPEDHLEHCPTSSHHIQLAILRPAAS